MALKELYNCNNNVEIIGTRHGEKLYETLVNREEIVKLDDLGDYYREPADNGDLNFDMYFSEGQTDVSEIEDYTSHNTQRFDVNDTKNFC